MSGILLSHECVVVRQNAAQFFDAAGQARAQSPFRPSHYTGDFPAGEAAHRRQEKKTAVLFRQIRDRFI